MNTTSMNDQGPALVGAGGECTPEQLLGLFDKQHGKNSSLWSAGLRDYAGSASEAKHSL